MVRCENCGRGRPNLWTKDGGFCDQDCLDKYLEKRGREKESSRFQESLRMGDHES